MNIEIWLNSLLMASLMGSALVILVALIESLFQPRIGHRLFYGFWLIVTIRFICFWTPPSDYSALNWFHGSSFSESQVAFVDSEPVTSDPVIEESVPWITASKGTASIVTSETSVAVPSVTVPSDRGLNQRFPTIAEFAFSVWLLGCTVLLVRTLRAWRAIQLLLKRSEHPCQYWVDEFHRIQESNPGWVSVRLRITDEIFGPCVTGVFRPTVLMPRDVMNHLDQEQIRMILIHEWKHARQLHGLIKWLVHLVGVIHWFNPLFRWIPRRIDALQEFAADNAVVEQGVHGEKGDAHRNVQAYGETILAMVQLANEGLNSSKPHSSLLYGFVDFRSHLIKERIQMLIKPNTTNSVVQVSAIVCAMIVMTTCFTSSVVAIHSPQSKSQQEQTSNETVVPTDPTSNPIVADLADLQPEPIIKEKDTPVVPQVSIEKKLTGLPLVQAAVDKPVKITLYVGEVKQISFEESLMRFSMPDQKVVRATPRSEKSILLVGVQPGIVDYQVSVSGGQMKSLEVTVLCNTKPLVETIRLAFPKQKIEVVPTPTKMVILRGVVDSEKTIAAIEALAGDLSELRILSQLEVAKPIEFHVQVFKIDKAKFKKLIQSTTDESEIQKLASLFGIESNQRSFATGLIGRESSKVKVLKKLIDEGIAKVVHKPVLTGITGGALEWKSGTEIPITVTQGTEKTIEFRHMGTLLKLIPQTTSENELLRLGLSVQLTEADESLQGSGWRGRSRVPGFRVRRINTGVEVEMGQTIGIVSQSEVQGNDSEISLMLITPKNQNNRSQGNEKFRYEKPTSTEADFIQAISNKK